MEVVISCDGDVVSKHFGRCEKYLFFETVENKVKNKYEIKNPGHRPGFLPRFLKSKGIQVLITGGIGHRALDLFNEYGIRVITFSGKVNDAIDNFCKGKLKQEVKPCEH